MHQNLRLFHTLFLAFVVLQSCYSQNRVIWQIGKADNRVAEFALSPDGYKHFLEHDFSWEDRFILVGNSQDKYDFPSILPGPSDEWGGTSGTAGWRSHSLNILFGIEKIPAQGQWKLVVDFFDINTSDTTVFKITINGKPLKYELPFRSESNTFDDTLTFILEARNASRKNK